MVKKLIFDIEHCYKKKLVSLEKINKKFVDEVDMFVSIVPGIDQLLSNEQKRLRKICESLISNKEEFEKTEFEFFKR